MARKASPLKRRTDQPPPTRFIVYRTARSYWIASVEGGRVTAAFPLPEERIAHARRSHPMPRS